MQVDPTKVADAALGKIRALLDNEPDKKAMDLHLAMDLVEAVVRLGIEAAVRVQLEVQPGASAVVELEGLPAQPSP